MHRAGLIVAVLFLVSPACSTDPIPEELGWYVVDGGELKALTKSENVGGSGLAVGNKAYGLKAISEVNVTDPNAYFIVFATKAPSIVEKIRISRFSWEASRDMTTFMNTRTNVPVELYTPSKEIAVGVVPMKQDERMFKLVPKEVLGVGPYGLYFGETQGLGSPTLDIYDFYVIPEDGEQLVEALHDERSEVRLTAADALSRLPAELRVAAVPALAEMLSEGDAVLRRRAAERLEDTDWFDLFERGESGKAVRAMPALSNALTDADPEVRQSCAEALKSILHKIQAALREPDLGIRVEITPEAHDAVIEIVGTLRHDDQVIRATGFDALRSLYGSLAQTAVPHLAEMLQDRDTELRFMTVGVLSSISEGVEETAAPVLIEALNDADPRVRREARLGLRVLKKHKEAQKGDERALKEIDLPLLAGVQGVSLPRRIEESVLKPVYPEQAVESDLEVRVMLQVVVQKDGTIGRKVEVLDCTHPGKGFEEALIEAVLQWRYEPATLDGKSVDVYYTLWFDFDSRNY